MAHPSQLVRIDGRAIRTIREEKGLTQLYLATYVGVTTDTVSRWENGKTQTIKRENLIKLAAALEVDPAEIVAPPEKEPVKDEGTEQGEPAHPEGERPATTPWLAFAAVALLLASAVLAYLLLHRTTSPSPVLQVHQWVPAHAPIGALFPVALHIEMEGGRLPINLLITQRLPQGVEFHGGAWKPVVRRGQGSILQWILSADRPELKFVYLCRLNGRGGGQIEGELLVRGERGERLTIGPSPPPVPAPFHWADEDRDGSIGDEELLTALDLLGSSPLLEAQRNEVKQLWAAGAYRWDPAQRRYEVKP